MNEAHERPPAKVCDVDDCNAWKSGEFDYCHHHKGLQQTDGAPENNGNAVKHNQTADRSKLWERMPDERQHLWEQIRQAQIDRHTERHGQEPNAEDIDAYEDRAWSSLVEDVHAFGAMRHLHACLVLLREVVHGHTVAVRFTTGPTAVAFVAHSNLLRSCRTVVPRSFAAVLVTSGALLNRGEVCAPRAVCRLLVNHTTLPAPNRSGLCFHTYSNAPHYNKTMGKP